MSRLSHLDSRGKAKMVDVALKQPTIRCAVAACEIHMKPETFALLEGGRLAKGDAFTVAKTAGILAVKRTAELIPLCHPLPIEHIEFRFFNRPQLDGFFIEAKIRTTAKTGVEMEALTGVAIAALTLYDMAKSSDPGMVIGDLHLVKKLGGKSDYKYSSRNHYGK